MAEDLASTSLLSFNKGSQRSSMVVVRAAKDGKTFKWYSILVCFGGMLVMTLSTGFHNSFGVVLPYIRNDFHVSKTKAAWVGALGFGMYALISPLIGRLCDKFSCRHIAILGSLGCMLGLFTTSLVPSVDVMFVTYGIIFASGSGACIHATYVEIARRFQKHRALATGVINTGWGLGTLTLSPLIHHLLGHFGWVMTFRILSTFFVAVMVLAFLYQSKYEKPEMEFVEKESDCRFFLDFTMFRDLNFTLLILGLSTYPMGYSTPSMFLLEHSTLLGVPSNEASLLYTWMGAANLLMRLVAGKILQRVDPIACLRTCLFLFGIMAYLFTFAKTLPWILVYCVLIGVIDGMCSLAAIMSIIKCVGLKKYPQGLGFYCLGQAVVFFIGPLLASLIIDFTDNTLNAWYFLGSITVVGSLILFGIKIKDNSKVEFFERLEIGSETEVLLMQKVSSV